MLKFVVVASVVIATAAIAQGPTAATKSAGLNGDPNQIVCVNERETGSRVTTRRVCRTRAEWAALEQQTRQSLDRIQNFKPVVCSEAAKMTC